MYKLMHKLPALRLTCMWKGTRCVPRQVFKSLEERTLEERHGLRQWLGF